MMMYAMRDAGYLMYVIGNVMIVRQMAIKKQNRKAQISIFTKPVMLIVLISIFAMFVMKTMQVNIYISNEADEYYFKIKSASMFDSIIRCIADNSTSYPYLVSAGKLDELNKDFVNREAPCMNDEKLGWSAVVEDVLSGGKSWQFGESEGSIYKALKHEQVMTMPVAIKYDDGAVNPGVINFKVMQGDLESIVGRIENVYKIGSETKKDVTAKITIRLDYPVMMNDVDGKKMICLATDEKEVCKTLSFSNIEFNKLEPGMHYTIIKYDPREKRLSVRD
ncbi:MAG: hypothetical protein ABIG84_07370 [archaeon]